MALPIQCARSPHDGLHCDHNIGAFVVTNGVAEGANCCCWCGRTERYKFFVIPATPVKHGQFKPAGRR